MSEPHSTFTGPNEKFKQTQITVNFSISKLLHETKTFHKILYNKELNNFFVTLN